MRVVFALIFLVMFGPSALAADLSLSIKTPSGDPVKDAVISFRPAAGAPAPRVQGPYFMVQEDIQFHPFVLVVPAGADVNFPNHDKVRHHVYSFSAAKRFELKLYGHDETRTVHFDKAGVVALGCNIHDKMVGFIKVVDTPFAVKTSPTTGDAMIQGAPGGAVTVRIWQPYLKAPNNEIVRTVTLPTKGAAREAFTLDLRPAPKPH